MSKDDIIRHGPNGPNETACLLGLAGKCFPKGDQFEWAIHNIAKVIREELGYNLRHIICDFNDNPKTDKRLIARVWNRTMFILGFTENNPESEPLKRQSKYWICNQFLRILAYIVTIVALFKGLCNASVAEG